MGVLPWNLIWCMPWPGHDAVEASQEFGSFHSIFAMISKRFEVSKPQWYIFIVWLRYEWGYQMTMDDTQALTDLRALIAFKHDLFLVLLFLYLINCIFVLSHSYAAVVGLRTSKFYIQEQHCYK